MWSVYEVTEGDCAGKFVLISIMGHPVLRDDEPAFFDSVEEADAYLTGIISNITSTVASIEQTPDFDSMSNKELFSLAMKCESNDGGDDHCDSCKAFAVWADRVSGDIPSMRD